VNEEVFDHDFDNNAEVNTDNYGVEQKTKFHLKFINTNSSEKVQLQVKNQH